jgi:glycosyltransferase involved in cell wall biosynthesis
MKISVLTPSFNSGKYIERAIKSVLIQNYQEFEHIIIDGKSTDNTLKIISKYDHLIWVSEKDNGQSDAMNKAFDLATGDVIVYLNADDYFLPMAFQRVISEFNNNLDVDIVVGNLVNEYDDYGSHITSPSIEFRKLLLPFKYGFPYNPVSYFYKKQVQKSVGKFPVDNHFVMDYWFILRSFKKFKVIKINFELGVFYHSGVNKTATNKNFSINRYAFNQAGEFGLFWQIYFLTNLVPELFKKAFYFFFRLIKYLFYLILLYKKVSYDDYVSWGFKKSFRKRYKNE